MTAAGASWLIDARYEVLGRLGEGGMGAVYLVADRRRGDARLALKLIPRDRLGGMSLRLFRDEFKTLSRLRHPNIVEVFDFGTTPDGLHFYYTSELIDGVDLVRATAECRSASTPEAAGAAYARLYEIVAQTAAALEHVHAQGYVHFDVKPANLLVSRARADGEVAVKLLDFGLSSERAAARRPGLRGTLPYMAPEVIRGDPVDRRADLYSLGAAIYEAAAGAPPFGGPGADIGEIERGHLTLDPPPPRERNAIVPPPLEKLILRLLRKDPAERCATAIQVVHLMRVMGGPSSPRSSDVPAPASPLRPAFVGREVERRALSDDVRAVERGEGPRIALIEGEAGAGKTRLLREARHGAALAGIASAEIDAALEATPGAAAAAIVSALGAAPTERSAGAAPTAASPPAALPPEATGPESAAERVAARVARSARSRPVALFLDGLESAPADVAAFLGRLVSSLAHRHDARRVLVVAAARSGETPPSLAAALDAAGARRVPLAPLEPREVGAMVRSSLGRRMKDDDAESRRLARLFHAEVGGNPRRVEGLLASLAEGGALKVAGGRFWLDASVLERPGPRPWAADLFGSVLGALPPDAVQLARRLAALERPADAFLLARVSGLDDERRRAALDALRRADVLAVRSGPRGRERIGFRHEGLARAARALCGDEEARRANDAAAALLEARLARRKAKGRPGPGLALLDRLAHHALRGGDRARAVRRALEAADRAAREGARERAAELYVAALESSAPEDAPARVRVLEELGLLDELSGRTAGARERYVAAIAAAERLPPGEASDLARGRLWLRQGTALTTLSDTRGARASLHRALRALPRAAAAFRCEVIVRLGWLAFMAPRGRAAAAVRLVRRGLRELRGAPPDGGSGPTTSIDQARYQAEAALGAFHEGMGALDAAHGHLREALRLARCERRPDSIVRTLGNLSRVIRRRRRLRAAAFLLASAVRLARRNGLVDAESHMRAQQGTLEWARGRHARAGRRFASAAKLFRTTGNIDMGTQAASNFAYALERRGDYAEALARHEGAAEQARRTGRRRAEIGARLGMASAALLTGDVEAAARALAAAEALLAEAGTATLRAEALEARARILRAEGKAVEALAAYDRARDIRAELAPALDGAAAALERVELMLEVRDPTAARLAWTEADARARDLKSPALRALSAYVRARIAAAEGKPRSAVRALLRAASALPEREDVDLAWRVAAALGRAYAGAGDPALGEAHLDRAARLLRGIDDRLPPDAAERFRRREGVADLLARRSAPAAAEPASDAAPAPPGSTAGAPPAAAAAPPGATGGTAAARAVTPHPQPPTGDPSASPPLGEVAEVILQVNRDLAAERDRGRLLERILDAAIRLSGAERGFIMLASRRSPTGLKFMVGRDLAHQDVRGRNAVSATIAGHVVETGRAAVVGDARLDPRFRASESVIGLGIASVLCVPLGAPGRVLGAVYVDHRFRTGAFGPREERAVAALADQATIALESSRLLRAAERAREEVEELNRRLEERLLRQDRELTAMRGSAAEAAGDAESARRYAGMIGAGAAMRELYRMIDRSAPTDIPVLVLGESGAGKELVARALHLNSGRKLGPFVIENCSAIPEPLLEAELFGAKRGAYTGAHSDRPGLFEVASGGTLFLDEVGDMSLAMQAKLLRALERGEYRPVGGTRVYRADVRILAATNKDLRAEIAAGRFREDLYYRLNGITVTAPPLRERTDDIPLLVDHFLELIAKRKSEPKKALGHGVLDILSAYGWPGNVRELLHEVERAAQLSEGTIEVDALSSQVRAAGVDGVSLREIGSCTLRQMQVSAERRVLLSALAKCGGNRTRAARLLGVSRFGLQKRLARCGIT